MASNGTLVQPDGSHVLSDDEIYRQLMQLAGRDLGLGDWGSSISHVSFESASEYAHTIENQGNGGHLLIPGELQVESDGTGTIIRALGVTGAFSAGATTLASLHVTGNSALDGTLGAGASTLASLHVTGTSALDGTLGVTGTSSLGVVNAGATTVTALTATGNVALGNANADTLTVIAASTFRNAAAAVQVFVDPANGRVIVGSATALGTAPNDTFTVAGGTAYFAGPNGPAIGIRYNAGATVGWTLGVNGAGADKDLQFLDDGAALVVTMHDTSFANYSLTLENGIHVKGPGDFDGPMSLGNASGDVIDARGSIKLWASLTTDTNIGINIDGSSVFAKGVTITTNGLTVTAGGMTVTSGGAAIIGTVGVTGAFSASASSSFGAGLSIAGGLSVTTGTVDVATAAKSATGTATTAGGALTLQLGTSGPNVYCGSGAPTVSATQGSLYLRTDGTTTNDRAYISRGGTTWTALTTVA